MANEDRLERWSAATGLVFVALFVALNFLGGESPPNPTAETVAAFYEEQGAAKTGAQYFVVGLGGAALLWFVGALRSFLRRAEGDPGRLSATAFGAGAATVGLVLVAGAAFIAPASVVVFSEDVRAIDPVLDEVVGSLGFIALNFGLVTSAVMFTATSLVALRTRVVPAWYAWIGFAVSLALVVNIFYFFGFFVWLAWILVTSIVMLARPSGARTRPTRAAPARSARR